MALPFFKWSRVAANNATADPTINWAEGMAPSGVNDSGRAMMASTSAFRDDIAGAIVTGGTSTAYTVSSYQVFDALANMNGQMIAFTPHTTSGATVTLNVDSLGAKPLRFSPGVELPAGTLIQGTPYVATYNNSDGAFYLRNFLGNNPYYIPIGGSIDFWLSTAPNSSFAFPYGQAISRTTYATLFAAMGTTYGTGDGSTTFNLPDCRGRITVAADNMGGAAAGRLTTAGGGIDGSTLGANGGNQSVTIAQNQLPNIAPTFTGNSSGQSFTFSGNSAVVQFGSSGPGGSWIQTLNNAAASTPTGAISSINGGVTQQAIKQMPPAIICNRILRII